MHRGFFLPVKAFPPAPNGPETGGGRCHATYLCGERFNSRPPRGGRHEALRHQGHLVEISIHALREEGDGYGNVLSISRSGNELHPTQKPVELLEKLVDNTDFATGVYDPFGGSGTTLAACEAYGQPSYIMELTPAFTDVIVKRYIRITGKTTVRCVRQGRELPREEIAAIFEPDEEGGEQE